MSWKTLFVAALVPLAASCAGARAGESAKRLNFVLINIDDLGYGDIGPFGSRLNRTPNLDRMAREGRKLTSFYGAPVCTPSRASLLTGCYPLRVGLPNVLFPRSPVGLSPREHTLASLLRRAGYVTMCIGKWHLGDQPEFLPTRHGFDHFFGLPYSNDMGPTKKAKKGKGRPPLPLLRDDQVVQAVSDAYQDKLTRRYTEEAVKFLRANRDRPFFLYLAHTAVHAPLHPGAEFRGKSKNGLYGDWVEEVDWSVGQVLGTLRELKLDGRTLVLFMSDNGGTPRASNGPLRGHKHTTWEGGIRVPAIAWWPGKVPAGKASDEIAGMMDVLPTFVKLAGGAVPADHRIDGKDIWPLLAGGPGAKSPHDAFFYYDGAALQKVRSGPWVRDLVAKKLYNLDQDIGEQADVADRHPDVVRRLEELAAAMRRDVGDRLPGPGCRPPGRVKAPTTLLPVEGSDTP